FCINLESIKISGRLPEIKSLAFYGCVNLKIVSLSEKTALFRFNDNFDEVKKLFNERKGLK
ncbi:MAG: hypothetical protein K2J36_01185, partial [Ruminococcus sp.]|nr:hypothetical protein [Ruminococcus sp.]